MRNPGCLSCPPSSSSSSFSSSSSLSSSSSSSLSSFSPFSDLQGAKLANLELGVRETLSSKLSCSGCRPPASIPICMPCGRSAPKGQDKMLYFWYGHACMEKFIVKSHVWALFLSFLELWSVSFMQGCNTAISPHFASTLPSDMILTSHQVHHRTSRWPWFVILIMFTKSEATILNIYSIP